MINKLIKLANALDESGFNKEADSVDHLIKLSDKKEEYTYKDILAISNDMKMPLLEGFGANPCIWGNKRANPNEIIDWSFDIRTTSGEMMTFVYMIIYSEVEYNAPEIRSAYEARSKLVRENRAEVYIRNNCKDVSEEDIRLAKKCLETPDLECLDSDDSGRLWYRTLNMCAMPICDKKPCESAWDPERKCIKEGPGPKLEPTKYPCETAWNPEPCDE